MLRPDPVRPLTMREIDRLIEGIVRGIAVHRPAIVGHLDEALTQARRRALTDETPTALDAGVDALGMTIVSLHEWCHPIDVATALARVHERLDEICRPGARDHADRLRCGG